MEAVAVLIALFSGYALGWWARGYNKITLEDIEREIAAADRNESLRDRARRVSRGNRK